MKRIVLPIGLCLTLAMAIGCGERSGSKVEEVEETAGDTLTLSDDFLEFYKRFHEDSVYQMEHITFPLMGGRISTDSLGGEVEKRWTRDEWRLHRPFNDPAGSFGRSYATPADDVVIERIDLKMGGLRIERRFARLQGGEWNLIYYAVREE